jgi:hypothetical protein
MPDIAVIAEIARLRESHEHSQWFGNNPRQGLAVISSAKYRLLPIPQIPEPPLYVIRIPNFSSLAGRLDKYVVNSAYHRFSKEDWQEKPGLLFTFTAIPQAIP